LARHAKERLEFYVVVAVSAGDGSAAAEVIVHEGANDAIFKLALEIHDIVRKIQVLRDALGVVDIVEGAAAMLGGAVTLKFRETALIPKLHREADDWTRLFLQYGSDGRRVDAAGHGDGDEAGLRFRADGKTLELGRGFHSFYFSGFCVASWSKKKGKKKI